MVVNTRIAQHNVEEVRKAIREALRESVYARKSTQPLPPTEAVPPAPHAQVDIEKDATVTVVKESAAVRTIVTSDEARGIVIVANPSKRLTARDKEARLLFDGEIETPAG